MTLAKQVLLSSLTTFKLGGAARIVATCETEEDLQTAITYARDRGLSWYVMGGGSNVLASDAGYEGVIIHPVLKEINFTASADGLTCEVEVGAGVVWEDLVDACIDRDLWGLENLAGIPGSVGAAPVGNIGAYGVETADLLTSLDALNTKTDTLQRFENNACAFEYRGSLFKHDPSFIVTRVRFILQTQANPRLAYADIQSRVQAGAVLDTPRAIAAVVREIRSQKFPDITQEGTAGSFFKNPIIPYNLFSELKKTYPDLKGFVMNESTSDGIHDAENPQPTTPVKVPTAWILDHILHLNGYTQGYVRLFEHQPIVIVATPGATSADVNALANEVASKVFAATGITLEREVRTLS